jgi:2'-5' RNA ligase
MTSAKLVGPRSQRLFLALWPDDAAKKAIAEHAVGWVFPAGCLRYAPADWHVTVHFIGTVATKRVPAIAAALGVPVEPFQLVLDRPQLWPRELAVVCATEVPAPLQALHDRLGHTLTKLDQAVDPRAYRPHLTLARRAGAAIPAPAPAPIAWNVRGYALVLSTGNADQRYEVLRRYG